MYPDNDKDFEEQKIKAVDGSREMGWSIQFEDGWSFSVSETSPVVPAVGMLSRTYGKGIGHRVRGLYLDGQCVFYRSVIEDDEFSEIEMYGRDAEDWLARWDSGRTCWTIEMGGLGPGYEQCIHIVCAETLRYWLATSVTEENFIEGKWQALTERTREHSFANKIVNDLGLSGAQYGAGVSIAAHIFRKGPRAIMKDPEVKDRKIQVSKNFPKAA